MQQHRLGRIARRPVAAEADRKIERHLVVKAHRRVDRIDLQIGEGAPVADQDVGVANRGLDVLGERRALRCGQVRHDVRDHHVEAGEHGMPRLDPPQHTVADVRHPDLATGLRDVHAGRLQAHADRLPVLIEPRVIERRLDHVLHRAARRNRGNERADQHPRQSRVAVREMIDVGLAPGGVGAARELQPGEARIAHVARLGRRHRVAAEPEEAERPALEIVGDLLAAAADLDQIVAIAGALQERLFFVGGLALLADRLRQRRAPEAAPCSPAKAEIGRRTPPAAWRCGGRIHRRWRAQARRSPARRGRTPRG